MTLQKFGLPALFRNFYILRGACWLLDETKKLRLLDVRATLPVTDRLLDILYLHTIVVFMTWIREGFNFV